MPRALFKQEISKRTWLRNQNSQVLELLVYEYTDWSNANDRYLLRQQFIDINSDATFKAPAIKSAKAFAKKQSPTYFYQLEIAPRVYPAIPFPTPPWLGVYHRADVFYTFGVPLVMSENLKSAAEVQLSKDIMTSWSNFAKTGWVLKAGTVWHSKVKSYMFGVLFLCSVILDVEEKQPWMWIRRSVNFFWNVFIQN